VDPLIDEDRCIATGGKYVTDQLDEYCFYGD
jgi:hypothetical protein